jgi:hypothetical protein
MRIAMIFAGFLFLVVLISLFGQSETPVTVPIENVQSATVHSALPSPTPPTSAPSTATTTAAGASASPKPTIRPHAIKAVERPTLLPSPTRTAMPVHSKPAPAKVRSVALKSSSPSSEMANRSPSTRRPSSCHSPRGTATSTLSELPALP